MLKRFGSIIYCMCLMLALVGCSEKYSEDEIRDKYVFDSRTSYCVPPALEAFFESTSYETAIRKAISIGGDSDTIACMTGGIAEAYYKCIPEKIMAEGSRFIDGGFKNVISDFTDKFLR